MPQAAYPFSYLTLWRLRRSKQNETTIIDMKRDKIVIGRVALSLAVVALTFALGSCTQEPIRLSMPGGDGMMVRVTFPSSVATRATTGGTEEGTNDENRLERVTILVFNQDGTKLETVLSEDVTATNGSLATSQPQWASKGTLLVSPIQNPASPKKIYAVANWSTTAFDKATYTEAKLKEELTTIAAVADINGAGAYPMLMSGSKAVASLSSAYYSVTVDMERQASKIRTLFTMPVDVQNYHPQIEWQTGLMKITVVNVPSKSYVVGRGATPSGSTLLNSAPLPVDDTQPAAGDQTVPARKDLKWSESLYIHENPVTGATPASKDASTCIVVQLPYKNRITGVVDMDNYYQLYINDTRDAASPHKMLRNTIYTLSIRILGMGLPINKLVPDVGVDDQLTVNSWEKGEIGDVEAPNYFFNIDRTYIVYQSFETPRNTIATDVPDWKLVKADGTTIFSFAEGKTANAVIDGVTYTLSGSASNATVTVNRPANVISAPINKMTFIAKNLKVPFTVTYENGVIPNSVLKDAGWPTDKLPPNGLQLAKRGDKVLPGGVAGSNDFKGQWQKSGGSFPRGSTSMELGMGVSNTAALLDVGSPAAQYCRDMGEGWFLPSQREFTLIYKNTSILADSYAFPTSTTYWSSTGADSNGFGVLIYFPSGQITMTIPGYSHYLRCVKGI